MLRSCFLSSFVEFHSAVSEETSGMCQPIRRRAAILLFRRQTRVPRGTDRSPEYKEHFCYKLDSRVKNVTTEWNQKQQHFITHALDHCYEFSLLLQPSGLKKFFEEGDPPWWPIWPRPRSTRGRYGLNIFMHVPGHEHFIPTKFRKHPLWLISGSVVKAGYVFPYIYMH